MKLIRNTSLAAALAAAFITNTAFAGEAAGVPKDYPLKTCLVSDEKLGEHGKPVKVTADGTDIWLCCKSCVKDVNKDPKKFAKMVRDAQAKK